MSQNDNRDAGRLVQAACRDLASVTAENPLVARGLADISRTREGLRQIEAIAVDLQKAIAHYLRGTDFFTSREHIQACKELDEAIRLFSECIRQSPRETFNRRHRAKACWCQSVLFEVLEDDADLQANCKFSLREKEYDDLMMLDFDEAIRLNPNDPVTFVERAEAWCWGRSSEKGMKDFQEAIRLDPLNPAWYALRGIECYSSKRIDQAIKDLNEAIRLNGNNSKVLIVFTPIEGQETPHNEYLDGNPTLNRYVHLNLFKHLEKACAKRGALFLDKSEYDEAIQDYGEAIRLNGKNDDYYYSRGIAWKCKGEHGSAIDDFDAAIRLNPSSPFAYVMRGEVWIEKDSDGSLLNEEQNQDRAIRDFDEAIRINPRTALAYIGRGRVRVAKGYYNKAFTDYDQALRLDPNNARAYYFRGLGKWHKRLYEMAISDLEQVVKINPSHLSALDLLAWLLATSPEAKYRDGERAIQLATNECELTGWINAVALNTLAAAYAESDQFDEAVSYQSRALENCRTSPAETFRQRLDLYKQGKPYRHRKGRETPPMLRSLVINLPGELSIKLRPRGMSVILAKTPRIVEISPITLAEAHEEYLVSRKERFEKLRAYNAPEVCLEIEMRTMNRCEDIWKNADHNPEDYDYDFKLQEGYFDCTEFGKELAKLSFLPQLRKLDMSNCPVTDEGLAHVRCLTDLRWLDLENCVELTDDGLSHLAGLPGLELLVLTGCLVTDRGLSHLCGLNNLQALTIEDCNNITQRGVTALKAALPDCDVECD